MYLAPFPETGNIATRTGPPGGDARSKPLAGPGPIPHGPAWADLSEDCHQAKYRESNP